MARDDSDKAVNERESSDAERWFGLRPEEDVKQHVRTRLKNLAENLYRASSGADRPGLTDARPPLQPRIGPGGAHYVHAAVKTSRHGDGDIAFWLYTPAEPTPAEAPVVAFLHGWGAMDPQGYSAWITHLVRRGNIVIYPVYQGSFYTPIPATASSSLLAVAKGVQQLRDAGEVRPDMDRFALVGHSLGGALAVRLAASGTTHGLTVARAVMAVQPGRGERAPRPLPTRTLETIPPETLMLLVVGSDDDIANDRGAKQIFCQTPQIATTNKEIVTLMSDYHGTPPLVANHSSPRGIEANLERPLRPLGMNGRRVDALSYYGYWKLFDGLTDAAFYGHNREYALGNTPEQRFLGLWSDGVPVRELEVTTSVDPTTLIDDSKDRGGWIEWRRTLRGAGGDRHRWK